MRAFAFYPRNAPTLHRAYVIRIHYCSSVHAHLVDTCVCLRGTVRFHLPICRGKCTRMISYEPTVCQAPGNLVSRNNVPRRTNFRDNGESANAERSFCSHQFVCVPSLPCFDRTRSQNYPRGCVNLILVACCVRGTGWCSTRHYC